MDVLITAEMLNNMPENYPLIFAALHPNGMTLSDLKERSTKRNYYRVVYQYVKEALDGQHRMES